MENLCLLFQFVTSHLGQTLRHKHFLESALPPRRPYSEVFHRAGYVPFFYGSQRVMEDQLASSNPLGPANVSRRSTTSAHSRYVFIETALGKRGHEAGRTMHGWTLLAGSGSIKIRRGEGGIVLSDRDRARHAEQQRPAHGRVRGATLPQRRAPTAAAWTACSHTAACRSPC